jgi:hypothetical protein
MSKAPTSWDCLRAAMLRDTPADSEPGVIMLNKAMELFLHLAEGGFLADKDAAIAAFDTDADVRVAIAWREMMMFRSMAKMPAND